MARKPEPDYAIQYQGDSQLVPTTDSSLVVSGLNANVIDFTQLPDNTATLAIVTWQDLFWVGNIDLETAPDGRYLKLESPTQQVSLYNLCQLIDVDCDTVDGLADWAKGLPDIASNWVSMFRMTQLPVDFVQATNGRCDAGSISDVQLIVDRRSRELSPSQSTTFAEIKRLAEVDNSQDNFCVSDKVQRLRLQRNRYTITPIADIA